MFRVLSNPNLWFCDKILASKQPVAKWWEYSENLDILVRNWRESMFLPSSLTRVSKETKDFCESLHLSSLVIMCFWGTGKGKQQNFASYFCAGKHFAQNFGWKFPNFFWKSQKRGISVCTRNCSPKHFLSYNNIQNILLLLCHSPIFCSYDSSVFIFTSNILTALSS